MQEETRRPISDPIVDIPALHIKGHTAVDLLHLLLTIGFNKTLEYCVSLRWLVHMWGIYIYLSWYCLQIYDSWKFELLVSLSPSKVFKRTFWRQNNTTGCPLVFVGWMKYAIAILPYIYLGSIIRCLIDGIEFSKTYKISSRSPQPIAILPVESMLPGFPGVRK